MASGDYDKRVGIFAHTVTQNDMNEDVKAWAEVKKLWAKVEFGSGAERRVGAAQEQSNLPVTVLVRKSEFSATIKPETHRLDFNGLQWDIESAAPSKLRNKDIMIIARARIN